MCGCAAVDDWLFISPHLDDVVLSCGGAVAKAARTGLPRIVTVFAGKPDDDLSEFARFQHDRWDLPHTEPVEIRRNEDRQAAGELGETVQVEWLDYQDAIYRDAGYSSDEALFGSPLPCDLVLVDDVYRSLRNLRSPRCVIPIGVGNHVDHQIVREAGLMLLREGVETWGYAEVPYALDETRLAFAMSNVNTSDALTVWLDDDALRRKCAATAAYASQLPVLFRDRGDPCEEIEAFARRQGGGEAAELLWRLLPETDPLLRRRPFVA